MSEFSTTRDTADLLKYSTVDDGKLYLLSAFTQTPEGGNPAGVWVGDSLPEESKMLRIAADVGFSETAFLAPDSEDNWITRYYSPAAEVSFCGHATIASGVVLGSTRGEGTYTLSTAVGDVPVAVGRTSDGAPQATLTSVDPSSRSVSDGILQRALVALNWNPSDLDENIPPALAYAGAWHLVLAVAEHETLRTVDLEHSYSALASVMEEEGITTLQLIWRQDDNTFHSRNPFPPGGIVEDPATGAAAAALGGYLRDLGSVTPPADVLIHQGTEMGRPSTLEVHIPETGGIRVSGTAAAITT